ncbi:hypothetical protein [Gynuella sunshinyii]|uniref:Uncharacterized protein n=1 Tax=Gynuella sunshinyii YC6258 TaxID=1445510 RepID=A0A0C5VK67_9GAMM|nr:hypothetical protein [Gynuella sunshinyii]AJQ95087.1 hypothetical Protein YC6258_03051 [Gynuella sunshinyii YC6258]
MIIKFKNEEFEFDSSEVDEYSINGHFKRSPEIKEQIERLENSLKEDWYLDRNGERLEDDLLFAASPWSIEAPFGQVKLIRRFHDLESGEAFFNTQLGYGGELFKWLRQN